MLLILIPSVIFAGSTLAILILVGIKLPSLSRLPELTPVDQSQRRRREKILKTRFHRIWSERFKGVGSIWRRLSLKIKQSFYILAKKIQNLEMKYKKQEVDTVSEKDKIQKMVWEAGELVNQGQFEEAEKKYIQIITWDHKNVDAYEGLADLYWKKKEYNQARETLEHVLKISPADPEIHWRLGSIIRDQGNNDEAYVRFTRAYEFGPNNPKYIDSLLDICILLSKKDLAWKLVSRLKEVNPDNQKLKDFEARIRAL